MFRKHSKYIATVVLGFFIWTSGGVCSLAHAAQLEANRPKTVAPQQKQKPASVEERFSRITEDLENTLADTKADTGSKTMRLKAGRDEIDKLDVEMRAQFAATELKLKNSKISAAILERHRKFVKHYYDNLTELKGNIKRVEKARNDAEAEAELLKVNEHLKQVKAQPRYQKLNSNNSSLRQPEFRKLEPRMQKEEFEKDIKKDKHAWKNAKRIMVASAGSLAGLLAASFVNAVTPPAAADLAETADVQLTPEIRSKALELGFQPLKIYEWVRNNIEFVPTWGSIQGAQMTLVTKQGNAFDTASLLIALLRASGINAHYAMGTIELPIDKFMSWAGGFTNPLAAVSLFANSGIPVRAITSGGAISKVQLEHVWVEAWIDYFPSRGAKHQAGQGDTWIPLDASFKQQNTSNGIDFTAGAPFDTHTFTSQLTGSSTINESESYATNVQCATVNQYQDGFRTQVQNFLAAEHPNATLSRVLGVRNLVAQEFPYLLGTLPYRTIVAGASYPEIPATFRHTVTFELVNNDPLSANYSEKSFSFSTNFSGVADKRVTLSYSPATAADEAVINAYVPGAHADGSPIGLNEFPSSLPAYLVQVKAELRVNGVVVASGLDTGLGGFEQLSIRISGPGRPSGSQEILLKAGEYAGVAFGAGAVPREQLEGVIAELGDTAARLKSGNLAGLTKDHVIGGFLHASALTHLAEIDAVSNVRAQVMGVAQVRQPSTSVMTLMLATSYFFGIPRGVSVAGPSTPEMGYHTAIAPKDGNQDKAHRFLLLSGLDTSALASTLQEYLLTSPGYPVTAVSAVKALKTASEQGIPLYRITPSNSTAIAGKLQLNEELKAAIANEANAGMNVIAPQRNVYIGAWSGSGYEAHDPGYGNNYTNLNGPPTTVQGMPWVSRSILLNLLPANASPPPVLSSAVINSSFIAGLGATASGLAGLPSRPVSSALNLLTTSLLYDRLGDQLSCYLDLATPSVPTGTCMAAFESLFCTALNTSVIADTNRKPVADAGADRLVGIGEFVVLDGSRSSDADNDPLTYQWRFTAIPQGSSATLANATSVAPAFTPDVAGGYTLELVVSDGKASSAPATVTITAAPAIVTIPQMSGLTLTDAQNVLQASGLTTGTITAATDSTIETGRIASQNPAASTGIGRGSAVNLVVSTGSQADTTPPVLSISLDRSPALYTAGAPVQVTINATDAVGISATTIAIDGGVAAAGLPLSIIDTTGFAAGSSHTILVTAQDLSANSTTASVTFGILDPKDITPPVVSLTSPTIDATITAPVDIRGTVTDSNLFEYTLAYAPAGKSNYTVFATGNRQITSGVLGRLDTSLMQNGLYDIILTAVDANGNSATQATRYRVTGDLKVGNFTVSFTDLNIPVSGIPVTVTRSYDSRNKNSGDFGVGWNIDIQSIKIEENAPPGEGWEMASSGGDWPTYCVGSQGERSIAVTLPDGKVEEFDLTATPKCQAYVPIQYPAISYTARPGTTSTLQAKNVGQVFYSPSGVLFDMDSLAPYNPSEYTLTTLDGTVFELDQGFGVRKVTDPNGNSLAYSAAGVIHSTGKSLAFSRDAKGRITRITEPTGKGISYSYDLSGNLETVTDPAGNITRYTYNSSHGLVDVIDPLGRRAVRNEYDNSGRLTAHIDAEGKRIEYNHNIAARQEAVKDRNGNITLFSYDDQGRVLQKTDPLGKTFSFSYDSVGNKLSETDPLENITRWTYDGKKNVLSETKTINGQNVTTRHTYNALGKVLTTTDPKGNVITNTYDPKGNLLTTTDALGNITTNTYDGNGNLLTTEDAAGNVTSYQYDGSGNRTKQSSASGAVTSSSFDSRGNKLTDTDAKGNITSYSYDNNGKLLKTTDALGNVTSYEYDKAGNKTAEINPLGNRTTYAYDSANRLILTTHPDGTTTGTTFDAEGNRIASIDKMGRSTAYRYNANKQLITTTYVDGTSQSIGYDAAGRQISSTDAKGKISTTEYDILGRVTKKTDPENRSITFEYDANGNQTKQTDANGHITSYEYDAANRLTKTILPGGQSSTTGYDALGRKITESDAAGNSTQFGYDVSGNLSSVTDALAQVTSYEYDANNNRIAIIDAKGHRTEFTFDKLNRMLTKTMPNGGVERYAYDVAGRQTSKTDAKGQTVSYSYDTAGRLTTRTYPDASTVTFSYTQTGKRATATDKRGTTTYSYDDRDRLTGTTTPDSKSLGYGYDPAGRIASISSFAGTINYSYSDSGRLTTVTDPQGKAASYSYDVAGNRIGLAFPNGANVTYNYDNNNRLTNLSHSAIIGQITSYTYTLGAIGNRTKIDEASGISRQYEYDKLYRLTKEHVTDPANTQTYTNDFSYDAVGNRQNKTKTLVTPPAISNGYSYNAADQLVSENGITYSYDLNGSLINKIDSSGTTIYAYNYDGRMVRVTSPTGTTTAYAYDVDGNRIESATETETVKYLVDTNRSLSQVVAGYKPDGVLIAAYTYADDLISMTRNGQTFWYHFDGLGSTRMLTDETGTVTDTYDYDAFGNLIARTGSTENSFLFTGQHFDANSGFYHLRARYYQPGVGRFISVDPYAGDVYAPATLHRYLYTANDPVNKVDLNGMDFDLGSLATSMAINGVLTASIGAINGQTTINSVIKNLVWGSAEGALFYSGSLVAIKLIAKYGVSLGIATKAIIIAKTSPTVEELMSMGIKGFEAHHILPEYLGKMLGYLPEEMIKHPGALISTLQHRLTSINPENVHRIIYNYLPRKKNIIYSAAEIEEGLMNAYMDLGVPDWFNEILPLIRKIR